MRNQSNSSETTYTPIKIGAGIGAAVGLLFLAFSIVTALGICSNTSAAETLFPYSMIIGPSLDALWPMVIIALIQYPIYGVIIGACCSPRRWHKYLGIPILLLVAEMHYLAVIQVQH